MWPFTRKKKVEEPTPAEVILEVQENHRQTPFQDAFLEAAREAAAERYKQEAELLENGKLHKYIQNATKYLMKNTFVKNEKTVLLGYYDMGVPEGAWGTFAEIYLKCLKTAGVEAELSAGNYIHVQTASVKKMVENIKPFRVDIDERMRAILSTGPYR